MFTRKLGRSGIRVSAMGMGCWAIGGAMWRGETPNGWGTVDDAESVRAIRRAIDLGINFLDTADVYGCGHSERLLAQALAGVRHRVVIASKFGNVFDEGTRQITGRDASPDYIRGACEASLTRLGTDYLDLYQFHLGDYDPLLAADVRDTLEGLVSAGKIRAYGWSTDDPERARVFAAGAHCTSVQHRLNLFDHNDAMLGLCDEMNLASINRGPLAMGILTGKFVADSRIPADDIRSRWNLREGPQAERLRALERLRGVLTSDGRTLAQAALGWLWAAHERTIPIPGFKTVAQVEENVAALRLGPLTAQQMAQVQAILA